MPDINLRWIQVNHTEDGTILRANIAAPSALEEGGIEARDINIEGEDLAGLEGAIDTFTRSIEAHLSGKRGLAVARTARVERPAPEPVAAPRTPVNNARQG
jgi:hypothetical protein